MSDKVDYIFPETLSIQNMTAFHVEMKKVFQKKKGAICLDLRNLKKMDLAIIQILAVYIKEGLEKDKNIQLLGPLDPLLQDSLEEMDIIRIDSAIPILFEQIQGGLKIEC